MGEGGRGGAMGACHGAEHRAVGSPGTDSLATAAWLAALRSAVFTATLPAPRVAVRPPGGIAVRAGVKGRWTELRFLQRTRSANCCGDTASTSAPRNNSRTALRKFCNCEACHTGGRWPYPRARLLTSW